MRDIRNEINDINDIVPFPTVIADIMSELISKDVAVGKVVKLVENDVALTTLILRIANSPYYGLRGEVNSVSSAILLLGLDEISRLMLIYQLKQRIFSLNREQRAYLQTLWKHSTSTAIIGREITKFLRYKTEGREFTAGLLHDMGKIVLVQHFSHSLIVTQKMIADLGSDDVEAEMQTLAISHAEIGGQLGEIWNLPPVFVEVMRTHHAPNDAVLDPVLVSIVRTADLLSEQWGFGIIERNMPMSVVEDESWKILTKEFPRLLDLEFGLLEQELRKAFDANIQFSQMISM
jgi:HD-like signal output (HDOD) protein